MSDSVGKWYENNLEKFFPFINYHFLVRSQFRMLMGFWMSGRNYYLGSRVPYDDTPCSFPCSETINLFKETNSLSVYSCITELSPSTRLIT